MRLGTASIVVAASVAVSPLAHAASGPTYLRELFARVQLLKHEYGEIMEAPSPDTVAQVAETAAQVVELARRGPEGAPYVGRLEAIREGAQKEAPPFELQPHFTSVMDELLATGSVPQFPAKTPPTERAAKLYRTSCAICHGARGKGDGAAAAHLVPRPVNFRDQELVAPMSPFFAYNAITYGISETSMASFNTLAEEDRWALAFYVLGLRHDTCKTELPQVSLEEQAMSSDIELTYRFGEAAVSCIRRAALRGKWPEARRADRPGVGKGPQRPGPSAYAR